MERAQRAVARVLDGLFPRFCVGCGKEGNLWCAVCDAGWWPTMMKLSCPFCGAASFGSPGSVCLACQDETFLDGVWTFVPYGNPVMRGALHAWKYVQDRSIEPVLERWVGRSASSWSFLREGTVFAPVPLHMRKARARGFDQAGLLTDWCAQRVSLPAADILVRKTATHSQARQSHHERQVGTLDGIFELHPWVTSVPARVVLVDDVFTSGATMDSAARTLKEAGVQSVWGFVLAKGN